VPGSDVTPKLLWMAIDAPHMTMGQITDLDGRVVMTGSTRN